MPRRSPLALALSLSLGASLAVLAAPALAAPERTLTLSPVGTHHTDVFDEAAAEIVEHDPVTQRLFVVNAEKGAVDVLDASDPTSLTQVLELSARGLTDRDGVTIDDDAQVNSVAIHHGIAAVAVEAGDKVSRGWVAFFRTSGDVPFLGAVRVGAQPDMVTFTPDGARVVTADEAEPADDFSSDPEGSVSVVDVAGALGSAGQSAVRIARFGDSVPSGVRIYGPDVPAPAGQPAAGRVARNLEPEYVAVDQQSRTAYVTLQENDAIAVVDLRSARVTRVMPLGVKDWAATASGFDASDKDGGIHLQKWPVKGLYLPDSIAAYQVRGVTYLVTANEGDSREWGSYVDAKRLSASAYPLCSNLDPGLTAAGKLGRLLVSEEDGIRPATATSPACREQVVALGGRSLSVWTTDGKQVADTGSTLEELLASGAGGTDPAQVFNAAHDENGSADKRSDDKGPEPEGVTIGKVEGRTYAFLGLERAGGVMAFDISDPASPRYVSYVNNRDFTADVESREAGDLGPEGLAFIAAEDSPTGRPLLAVGNEVSGTTTVFGITR